jgi:hypothetical protein
MDGLESALRRAKEEEDISGKHFTNELTKEFPEVLRIEMGTPFAGFDPADSRISRSFSDLRPESVARITNMGERCAKYLKLPIVIDSFNTDNPAREAWFKTLNSEKWALFRTTKLRGGELNRITMGFELLRAALEKESDQGRTDVQDLLKICDKVPRIRNYQTWTTDEKVALAKKLEGIAREYLQYITTRETPTVH